MPLEQKMRQVAEFSTKEKYSLEEHSNEAFDWKAFYEVCDAMSTGLQR